MKRTFERLFAHAQYSKEYTCLAREDAAFYERYKAKANEELEQHMIGRCGAADASASKSLTYYSDGTILDGPLSDEALLEIAKGLTEDLSEFTVFGITARYDGPNMLVWLETGAPRATMKVGAADTDGRVRVHGEIFGAFEGARLLINQGEVTTAECDPDLEVQWPQYAFTCTMAPGDDEAWLGLLARTVDTKMDVPLLDLPAHSAEWAAPSEYRRHQLALAQVDTSSALLVRINELRHEAGRRPLTFVPEQSRYLQQLYPPVFAHGARDSGDESFSRSALRGEYLMSPVSWARLASGIAFDGDAADWLAYRMMLPVSRNTLMLDEMDEVAIATHGDPAVGFGAVVALYQLLTPEREVTLADELFDAIRRARKGRPTTRLENPSELLEAARRVGRGEHSLKEISAALGRASLALTGKERISGFFVAPDDVRSPQLRPLLEARESRFGVLVTHVEDPFFGWASPVALIWFLTERPAQQQAVASPPETMTSLTRLACAISDRSCANRRGTTRGPDDDARPDG